MANEYDNQFEVLAQLIKQNVERSDARFDQLADGIGSLSGRNDSRFDDLGKIVQRTNGRLEELTLEVRDLRKTLLATNEKIDILHSEVTGKPDSRIETY